MHTLTDLDHAFRLVVLRTPADVDPLFPGQVVYRYWAVATNIPRDQLEGEALLPHHQARGTAEQWIGEAKDGLPLRHLPCGHGVANGLYFAVGMLAYSLLKLLQRLVLPAAWARRTLRGLRARCLRWVGKVTRHARQVWPQINAPPDTLDRIRTVRARIAALA